MIKSLLMVVSMLAVGVLVWRALQRQESGRDEGPSD
jgi:hypothetical protein